MLSKGAAKKVTIYVNEDTLYDLRTLHDAILNYLLRKGVTGATASRALAGFGPHHVLHTPKVEVLSEHLPIRIEFIESAEKVDAVLPTLYDMVTDGLIEVQDTTIIKSAMNEQPDATRHPRQRQEGKAKLMRMFLGEADLWNGEPLYEAIVKQLRMMEIAGATVYRGILGYGAKGHPHKSGLFHLSRDLPLTIEVIDSEDKLNEAREKIESMMHDGLIVMSDVDIIRIVGQN
jgi:PII-like signaling protein